MSDLIDTTEMYLKSIMEVLEEGAVPLRARIAERLGHSGPTVSQTVARMERDGLLTVEPDRRITLTEEGRKLGVRVLRKHRLVERLLIDIIGVEWEKAHDEACRWEHVISDDVERKIVLLLTGDAVDPFGNPIPGLDELDSKLHVIGRAADSETLADLAARRGELVGAGADTADEMVLSVRVESIGETLQADSELLTALSKAEILPGAEVELRLGEESASLAGVVLHTDEFRHLRVAALGR